MAITQMHIIQSLGEAMNWFQREIEWGVPATELRHLCGRIGELYAALITNGQLANDVNQKGYDVVSSIGERVSVKTTARMDMSGHISFNTNTLEHVDRVIILRMNTDEMQIDTLLDSSVDNARTMMTHDSVTKKSIIAFSKLAQRAVRSTDILSIKEVEISGYLVRELETGTIEIVKDGNNISPVKPKLLEFADSLGISPLTENGTKKNTRQLGSLIIKSIENRR
jgi:hypothetical protein